MKILDKIVTKSMQLAKRQRTWFKKEQALEIAEAPLELEKFVESLTFTDAF